MRGGDFGLDLWDYAEADESWNASRILADAVRLVAESLSGNYVTRAESAAALTDELPIRLRGRHDPTGGAGLPVIPECMRYSFRCGGRMVARDRIISARSRVRGCEAWCWPLCVKWLESSRNQ